MVKSNLKPVTKKAPKALTKAAKRAAAKRAAAKKAPKAPKAPKEPTERTIRAELRRQEEALNRKNLHAFVFAHYEPTKVSLLRKRRNAVAREATKGMDEADKAAIREAGKAAVEAAVIPEPTHAEIMEACHKAYARHESACEDEVARLEQRQAQIAATFDEWKAEKRIPMARSIKRKRQERKAKAPKKPVAPYMYYMQAHRAEVIAENPGIKFAQLSRTIGANWKALSEEARAPFVAMNARDKARYEAERAVYEADMVANYKRAKVDA